MLRLVGIVDYDASGDMIATSFAQQLREAGVEVTSNELLIHPKHYTPEELRMFKFPLPKGQETKTKRWLEKTGGIGQEAYGLESESMPLERINKLLRETLAKLTQTPTAPTL